MGVFIVGVEGGRGCCFVCKGRDNNTLWCWVSELVLKYYILCVATFYVCVCVQSIAISELICRGAKHMFKCYMQGVDMMNLSSAISHFLNCFLGSYPSPHAQVNAEEVSSNMTGTSPVVIEHCSALNLWLPKDFADPSGCGLVHSGQQRGEQWCAGAPEWPWCGWISPVVITKCSSSVCAGH